jgi:hypothetical protein
MGFNSGLEGLNWALDGVSGQVTRVPLYGRLGYL